MLMNDSGMATRNIKHRDGRIEAFDLLRLEDSIRKAFTIAGVSEQPGRSIRHLAEQIAMQIYQFDPQAIPSTIQIREATASVLRKHELEIVAQAYAGRSVPSVSTYAFVGMQPSESPSIPSPGVNPPRRHRLNEERKAITHKFQIGTHEGYLTVGLYDDTRQPGEIFLRMSKEGSVMSGLVDAFATSISIGLQYGVPLKVFVNKFANMRFEPSGATQNPNIPETKSIVDYVFRWLALKFLNPEERHGIGIHDQAAGVPISPLTNHPVTRLNGDDHQPTLMDSGLFENSSLE